MPALRVRAVADPDAFRAELAAIAGINPDAIVARYRDRSGVETLAWFDEARADLLATFARPRTAFEDDARAGRRKSFMPNGPWYLSHRPRCAVRRQALVRRLP